MPGFDLRRAFNDAFAVYQKNILVLIVAAFLFTVLGAFSLGVLAGPLSGGICLMLLKAMQRDDRTVELGDMFSAFDRFGPLVGLFYLTFFAYVFGLSCFIVPGVALMTLWLYAFYLVVDRGLPVFDALSASWQLVLRKGIWPNVILVVVHLAIGAAPNAIPYVGWLIPCVTMPLVWLAVTSAYIQQVHEDQGQLTDLWPAAAAALPAAEPSPPQ
jgi:hypothetical protein